MKANTKRKTRVRYRRAMLTGVDRRIVDMDEGERDVIALLYSKRQRPTSRRERTFYRFNYVAQWCEVAPLQKAALYTRVKTGKRITHEHMTMSLACCCPLVIFTSLQQRKRKSIDS